MLRRTRRRTLGGLHGHSTSCLTVCESVGHGAAPSNDALRRAERGGAVIGTMGLDAPPKALAVEAAEAAHNATPAARALGVAREKNDNRCGLGEDSTWKLRPVPPAHSVAPGEPGGSRLRCRQLSIASLSRKAYRNGGGSRRMVEGEAERFVLGAANNDAEVHQRQFPGDAMADEWATRRWTSSLHEQPDLREAARYLGETAWPLYRDALRQAVQLLSGPVAFHIEEWLELAVPENTQQSLTPEQVTAFNARLSLRDQMLLVRAGGPEIIATYTARKRTQTRQ